MMTDDLAVLVSFETLHPYFGGYKIDGKIIYNGIH